MVECDQHVLNLLKRQVIHTVLHPEETYRIPVKNRHYCNVLEILLHSDSLLGLVVFQKVRLTAMCTLQTKTVLYMHFTILAFEERVERLELEA